MGYSTNYIENHLQKGIGMAVSIHFNYKEQIRGEYNQLSNKVIFEIAQRKM